MRRAKFSLLLLLLMLLLNVLDNSCVGFSVVAEGTNNVTLATQCSYAIPHENETGLFDALHQTECPEMEASLFSHRVRTASASDSLQATEFSAGGTTNLTGHFEFEHSLTNADTLLILLGEAEEFGSGHDCRRLAVCSQSADGRSRRLRLSVSLRPDRSYTMKLFKLTNGSALCEPPLVRFFFTRATATERPLLQLAARRCGRCGDADFRCGLDAYLLTDRPDRLRLRVQELSRGPDGIYGFNKTNNNRWATQSMVVKISNYLGIVLLIDFFEDGKKILASRRQFHAIRSKGESVKKLLYSQLCQQLTIVWRNDTRRCPAAADDAASEGVDPGLKIVAPVLALVILCLLALLIYLFLVGQRRKIRARLRSVLVLPDQGDDGCRRATVRQLQSKLAGFGFDVWKIVKLRRLPQIVRSSRHIIFVSWDETFQCFQMGSLPAKERQMLSTLLLAEKHRVRGFYLESNRTNGGQFLQLTENETGQFWAEIKTRQLGFDNASIESSVQWLFSELVLEADEMYPATGLMHGMMICKTWYL